MKPHPVAYALIVESLIADSCPGLVRPPYGESTTTHANLHGKAHMRHISVIFILAGKSTEMHFVT
eukprot:5957501-Amphidinium_carterae.2